MPSFHSSAVEFVDDYLELTVRTNKHVVGSAVEHDLLFVGDHDLVRIRAGRSALGTYAETGVCAPVVAVLYVEHVGVCDKINLAAFEWIAWADVKMDKRLAVFRNSIAFIQLDHGLNEPLLMLWIDKDGFFGDLA